MLVFLSQSCLRGVNSAHFFNTCLVYLEEMAGNIGARFSLHGPCTGDRNDAFQLGAIINVCLSMKLSVLPVSIPVLVTSIVVSSTATTMLKFLLVFLVFHFVNCPDLIPPHVP